MTQSLQPPKKPRRPRLLHLNDHYYCSLFNGIQKQCELGRHIYETKPGDEEEREELYETLYRQIRERLQTFEDRYLKDVEERRRAVAEFDAAERRRQAEECETES